MEDQLPRGAGVISGGREAACNSLHLEAVGLADFTRLVPAGRTGRHSLLMQSSVISSAVVINPEAPCRSLHYQEGNACHVEDG